MKFHFSMNRVENRDKPLTYRESLMLDLQKTRWELENAYAGFDYATDPDLIDCYIYEQNAVLKRYRYLLHLVSELTPSDASGQEKAPVGAAGSSALCSSPSVSCR